MRRLAPAAWTFALNFALGLVAAAAALALGALAGAADFPVPVAALALATAARPLATRSPRLAAALRFTAIVGFLPAVNCWTLALAAAPRGARPRLLGGHMTLALPDDRRAHFSVAADGTWELSLYQPDADAEWPVRRWAPDEALFPVALGAARQVARACAAAARYVRETSQKAT